MRPLAAGLLALTSFAAGSALAEPAEGPRFREWTGPKPQVDCQCRRPGGARVDIGAVVCLRYGSEWRRARCEMPQNLPVWRIFDEACAPERVS